ncbi:MAG: hypothetical protein ABI155_14065, partial [Paralcaligenes sp.]
MSNDQGKAGSVLVSVCLETAEAGSWYTINVSGLGNIEQADKLNAAINIPTRQMIFARHRELIMVETPVLFRGPTNNWWGFLPDG